MSRRDCCGTWMDVSSDIYACRSTCEVALRYLQCSLQSFRQLSGAVVKLIAVSSQKKAFLLPDAIADSWRICYPCSKFEAANASSSGMGIVPRPQFFGVSAVKESPGSGRVTPQLQWCVQEHLVSRRHRTQTGAYDRAEAVHPTSAQAQLPPAHLSPAPGGVVAGAAADASSWSRPAVVGLAASSLFHTEHSAIALARLRQSSKLVQSSKRHT